MQSRLDKFRQERRDEDATDGGRQPRVRGGFEVPLACLSRMALTALQQALSVTPKATYDRAQVPEAIQCYKLTGTRIIVPRAFGWQRFPTVRFEDDRCLGEPLPPSEFHGELKAQQLEAFRRSCEALTREPRVCMLTMPCGFGKTVVALRIALEVGKRTLVVVHKEFLLAQWKNRIAQFLPTLRVTILQGSKVADPDADIVLAMLQTLCIRLPDGTSEASEVVSRCGLAIVDEAHHMAARSFGELFFHLPVAAILGLTATPKRKDGCTSILHMHMGDHSFLLEDCQTRRERPTVCFVTYSSPGRTTRDLSAGETQRLKTGMTKDDLRNQVICEECVRLAKEGRQIICLSDRVAHLSDLLTRFQKETKGVLPASLYVGGQKKETREWAEKECVVLFGTFAMAQEGLDIPRLDTLILASPASDITQAVGRILRPCAEKSPPLIVDIQDDACQQFSRQNLSRRRFYTKHGILLHGEARSSSLLDCAPLANSSLPEEEEEEQLPLSPKRRRIRLPANF